MKTKLGLPCAVLALASCASTPSIKVLSSRPDTVSSGNALIAVALPKGANASELKVSVAASDVTSSFHPKGGAMVGLVSGLQPGKTVVTAKLAGRSSRLTLVNHGRSGPIFSGPQQSPFICETESFKLPDGSTLGPAQDAACNAPTKVMFVYRSAADQRFKLLPEGPLPTDLTTTTSLNGQTVNYIVRLETGVINRSIYQIALLLDPTRDEPPSPAARYRGWNGRAVFAFSGGATAGYHQGTEADALLQEAALSRGFAVMVSTLNVMGIVGNDVVSAETASMVKEHFIETFGPPQYVIGWGGSGGSMQQHLIANNYPGILDGITPGASFPDLYSLMPYAVDCALLVKAIGSGNQAWTEEQKRATSGLNTWNTCVGWAMIFTPQGIQARQAKPPPPGLPHSSCHSVVPRALTYDPVSNPRGARCDLYSAARNSLGFEPKTGFTYRGYDNVGVQYGLKAYKAGAISAEQFVELNEKVGGFDDDGEYRPARAAASPIALQRMFEYGRINEGDNLDDLPIIDIRGNPGLMHDVHDAVKSENMRARLIRANGNATGQVIVRGEAPPTMAGSGDVSHAAEMNLFVLLKIDEWLANITRDTRIYPDKAAKVVANKPKELATDLCFMADGSRIEEASDLGNSGPCGRKLPYFEDPRMVAGAPLTNDVLKCQLRPFDAADYPGMAPALVARLKAVHPSGVCDYGKPSVGYRRLKGTWLSYPEPGVAEPLE